MAVLKIITFKQKQHLRTMMSFLKKFLKSNRNKLENRNEKVYTYDVKDYDETFETISMVMTFTGIRLTDDDPPRKRFWWDAYFWFEFFNMVFSLILELIMMVSTARSGTFQDAVAIFRMTPCVGYVVLGMAKSFKIVYYRPVYDNLVRQLRAMWPRGIVTEEEHIILSKALKRLYFVIKGFFWCNNVLLLVYMSTPFIFYFRSLIGHDVKLLLPFFYWFPFDPYESDYFVLIMIMQTWQGVVCIYFILCGDLLFYNLMSHISTQFELLAIRVRKTVYVEIDGQLLAHFPLAEYSQEHKKKKNKVVHMNDADSQRFYKKEIIDIILRHQMLIGLSKDVEDQFSFALLLNFVSSSIIICFCGFCCAVVEKWNEMDYKFFLITALCQTLLLCLYGQRLLESVIIYRANLPLCVGAYHKSLNLPSSRTCWFPRVVFLQTCFQSQGIADAVYNSGWYKIGKKINSSLMILLLRSQKGVHVTTYGFSIISLQSYTTIIKTSWSYFTLLLTIYKK